MPTTAFTAAFAERVRANPRAIALSHNGTTTDYGTLSQQVAEAAADLSGLGIGPDLPVCVPAEKNPDTIALLIAAVNAGRRVLVPSASLGAEALERLCAVAGCADILTATGTGVIARASGAAGRPWQGAGLLLTTSGSTGTPKIVELSGDGVDAFVGWSSRTFAIGADSTVLNYAPLNFDLCLLDVWAALAAGAEVALVDPEHAADGARLARLCRDRKPTLVQAVPLLFRLVTDQGEQFPSVRDVLLTGDVVPLALLDRILVTFPNARVWNVYGCTETNDSFLYRVDPAAPYEYGELPIGEPIDGVEALIVDADGTEVVGAGSGELVVRTPFRAHGYVGTPADDPCWRDGWFRTGDLIRRDENGLHLLTGRNDHQVKVRGVRTNLQEIEQVILSHPEVAEAAVVAIRDEQAGNVLRAVIRRSPDSRTNGLQLRLHCAAALPRTAIPSAFEILDEALPRTSTGKVDRTLLRARATAARPDKEFAS